MRARAGQHACLAMFGLPSAHSFPFVKQDRSTCRRHMRTVYWQNGEQVSRTVLTLRFQLVCPVVHQAAGMQQYLHELISKLYLRTMKIGKRYNNIQPRSVTEVCSECRRMERVLSLVRSIGEAACENKAAHAHLHDVRCRSYNGPLRRLGWLAFPKFCGRRYIY